MLPSLGQVLLFLLGGLVAVVLIVAAFFGRSDPKCKDRLWAANLSWRVLQEEYDITLPPWLFEHANQGAVKDADQIIYHGIDLRGDPHVASKLALFTTIAQALSLSSEQRFVCDAGPESGKKEAVELCSCTYYDDGLGADRRMSVPTVFFMLGCDLRGYERIVRANWDRLHLIAFVGVDLAAAMASASPNNLQQYPCLAAAVHTFVLNTTVIAGDCKTRLDPNNTSRIDCNLMTFATQMQWLAARDGSGWKDKNGWHVTRGYQTWKDRCDYAVWDAMARWPKVPPRPTALAFVSDQVCNAEETK
jgi:hypothetical protein